MDFNYVATNFEKYNFLIVGTDYSINTEKYVGCIFTAGQNSQGDSITFTNSDNDLKIIVMENVNTSITIKSLK